MGHDVGRGTIATVLRPHGIEPAPERRTGTTWREFLKAHWDVLAAADFFTVEVWTATGLTRYVVLFVIELATRRVHIAGHPVAPCCDASTMTLEQLIEEFVPLRRYRAVEVDEFFV